MINTLKMIKKLVEIILIEKFGSLDQAEKILTQTYGYQFSIEEDYSNDNIKKRISICENHISEIINYFCIK